MPKRYMWMNDGDNKMTDKSYEIKNKNLRLVKVDTDNFYELSLLSVNDDQKGFVADNVFSLALAYATVAEGRFAQAFGIYDGDTPVGFVMIGFNNVFGCKDEVPDFIKNNYLIWRFMIDKKYQKKGYGKDGVKLVLDYIRTFPAGKAEYCWLSYEPENETARELYRFFGFKEREDYYYEGYEMPAVLKL
ncbi:MAG: GNAT family N-acetyltransferase [Erysipelotrichaceae bacterium]|nr:GNAT family N-acetyltransferase [Erysipelotrichaceae bacterium]